jgi:MFS family permease
MANLAPVQLLLPDQFDSIDKAHKVGDLGAVLGIGGLVTLVTLPLCGALCDHTRSRFGRRRVWMGGGILVFAVGVAATGAFHSMAGIAGAWVVASVGMSMATAGLTAAVADQVPDEQRGTISAAMFGPQALGILIGLIALTTVFTSTRGGYLFLAVALIVLALPFIRRYRDLAEDRQVAALTTAAILRSIWVNPRANPDFAWAFAGRVMVNLGNALGTCYLLYFFQDYLRLGDPDAALLVTTAIYLVFTLASTYGGGVLSDRTGRRRIFVASASALQAIAALLLVAWPGLATALVAAAFLGAGYGAFLSVDQALVIHVLPDAHWRAKDLGIMNLGTNAPQALAPLAASVFISSLGGYLVLFAAAGAATLLGAVMVFRIKGVR